MDDLIIKNIRSLIGVDDTELSASLKQFGWVKFLPAIADEHGVTLVGNRRLKLAKELGIEPVIMTVTFGDGSAADAERVKLAIASNIGGQPLSKDDRKRIAEHLYGEREWTMERIAAALNTTHKTISKDLENCTQGTNQKRAKTETNPKGSGRRKGSTRKSKPRQTASKEAQIIGLSDAGMNSSEIATEIGVEGRAVRHVLEDERIRQEAMPVDWNSIPATAQQKIQAEINRHKRKLDAEFEMRTREECRRWLNEISLPQYAKELSELERSISSRKGVMDRITYRKILAFLHPDRVQDPILKKRYEEAFRLFTELEKRVLDEKESPTQFRPVPKSVEELLAQRAKVKAANRAAAAARKATRNFPSQR